MSDRPFNPFRRLGGMRCTLTILLVISFVVVFPFLWWEQHQYPALKANSTSTAPVQTTPTTAPAAHVRRKRSTQETTDPCLRRYGGIELNYTRGSNTTFTFDLCDVIRCGTTPSQWRGYDVYMFDSYSGSPLTADNGWCSHWGRVLCGTGPNYLGGGWITSRKGSNTAGIQAAGSLARSQITTGKLNALMFNLRNLTSNPYGRTKSGTYCDQSANSMTFVLGVDHAGTDTKALVRVNLIALLLDPPNVTSSNNQTSPITDSDAKALSTDDFSVLDILEIETGVSHYNSWLVEMASNANAAGIGGCVVCSVAVRLLLAPVPSLFSISEYAQCILQAHNDSNVPTACSSISGFNLTDVHPVAPANARPPTYLRNSIPHVCVTRMGAKDVGHFTHCNTIITVNVFAYYLVAHADLWWQCGGSRLRSTRPTGPGHLPS
uniref:Uncharacterized protein n=1 Tax=Scophthalmus maximus TaxID=52904 RepID=A0A8D3AXG9_SCOMX